MRGVVRRKRESAVFPGLSAPQDSGGRTVQKNAAQVDPLPRSEFDERNGGSGQRLPAFGVDHQRAGRFFLFRGRFRRRRLFPAPPGQGRTNRSDILFRPRVFLRGAQSGGGFFLPRPFHVPGRVEKKGSGRGQTEPEQVVVHAHVSLSSRNRLPIVCGATVRRKKKDRGESEDFIIRPFRLPLDAGALQCSNDFVS